MSKFNSKALRQMAEDVLEKIAKNHEVPESLRGDFATSLVRQWITYEGKAGPGDAGQFILLPLPQANAPKKPK